MPEAGGISYCTGLTLAGGGWRLPNIREAASILHRVDPNATTLLDLKAFPTATTDWMWSSTSKHGSSTETWQVNFGLSVPGTYFDTATNSVKVRCVK